MQTIYINETPLYLVEKSQLNNNRELGPNLLVRYSGNPRSLLSPIDMLEKTQRWESVTIYHTNLEQLLEDFYSLYTIIEAAGGVVYNRKGKKILTMFRRGFWDLPKGKIDPGETPAAAAVREVQEETGLNSVYLGDYIGETLHTYRTRKEKRVIKKTYWYQMSTQEKEIKPQIEEDIELVKWTKPKKFLKKAPLYKTIKVVVEASIKMKKALKEAVI